MGFLLPAMSRAKLDGERDVVKNERRERVDNVPYGRADETIREALYPAGHPYQHSVIGSMADLSAARPDDVAAFFRTYYSPNNAILCVAGDFAPAQVRGWIDRYFGPLPRGPRANRREGEPPCEPVSKMARAEPRPPAAVPHPPLRTHEAERPGAHRPEADPADRRRQPAPRPAHLADRPRRACRRAGARRPGGRPGRPRQGEPALSRLDVRPPARRQRGRFAPDPPALRRVRGRAVRAPGQGPRRAGQARRCRDRAAQAAKARPRSRSARPRTSGRAS